MNKNIHSAPPFLRRRRPTANNGRNAQIGLGAIFLGLVLYGVFLGDHGYFQMRALEQRRSVLMTNVQATEQNNQVMVQDLEELSQHGSFILEETARDLYGLQGEDERIIHVIDGKEAGPTP